MNSSGNGTICPPRIPFAPVTHNVMIGLAVLYPCLIVLMILHFVYHRKSSVLLRRRSVVLILISALGCLFGYFAMTFKNFVDLPCAVRAALGQASVPLITVPVIIRVCQYRSAVRISKIKSKRTIPERSLPATVPSAISVVDEKESNYSLFCGSVDCCVKWNGIQTLKHNDELQALRCINGIGFVWFWIVIASIPWIVFYFAELARNPVWIYCTYCPLDHTESIFRLAAIGVLLLIAILVGVSLSRHPDPLKIVMEMYLVSVSEALFTGVSLLLYMTDPGDLQSHGWMFWRWIEYISGLLIVFFQTSFHVYYLKCSRWSARNLTLEHFDADEVLRDIRASPRLLAVLRNHMQQELSYENLQFIEEVETWKSRYRPKDARTEREARLIYHDFISSHGFDQINISYEAQTRAEEECLDGRGGISISTFDPALKEVYELIKTDTLPRFLHTSAFKAAVGNSFFRSRGHHPSNNDESIRAACNSALSIEGTGQNTCHGNGSPRQHAAATAPVPSNTDAAATAPVPSNTDAVELV